MIRDNLIRLAFSDNCADRMNAELISDALNVALLFKSANSIDYKFLSYSSGDGSGTGYYGDSDGDGYLPNDQNDYDVRNKNGDGHGCGSCFYVSSHDTGNGRFTELNLFLAYF